METVEEFKGAIKMETENSCVGFVSDTWLESNLSETYLQGLSLIAGRQLKFYHFKENVVYLCICFL